MRVKMKRKQYASQFTQLNETKKVNGVLELKTNFTSKKRVLMWTKKRRKTEKLIRQLVK